MRKTIGNIGYVALLGVSLFAFQTTPASAGSVQSAIGTVSTVSGNTLVLKTGGSSQPLNCTDTKSTLFVNSIGVPVPASSLKAGVPCTIYYTTSGNTLVCSKVVIGDCSNPPGCKNPCPVSP